ncbi:uncharacterized protein TRIADDRAFT_63653 [Trichoplax adhaerens]|uniref:Rab-like protein 6 n=1 Tax=Trichoplax adhaerens TaxID=10228 RepID=B3RP63_TRIAD|nr:hypothetical protein TRIADDRAFT_63653 [Trichoplax adhaerens]EDV28137.1 hypothetical protein TRIADDRAFT_63653 [Trichoplax adhaerens]|eukprot:XP_002109971.1 hypothetical protein TRIADDRAFT_63653 [Trichoplax adhaerens]
MFQALKKIASRSTNEENRPTPPTGVQVMDQTLKKKYARGVQYNIKVIIKGDRNTGKSCLWNRLQGRPFAEGYTPTNEIQVANIHWNYKASDDVVKVEVWDVVDKGRAKKKANASLKLTNNEVDDKDDTNERVLDAEFVDVYKGTNGVIMLFDITKPWTFQYVERELPKVPKHLPVLILANCRDMGDHRLVTEEEAIEWLRQFDDREDSASIRYAESSMKNGYGLKYLYKYFNLPYLHLQRETLLKQLKINTDDISVNNTLFFLLRNFPISQHSLSIPFIFFSNEIQAAIEELDIHLESEEQNYKLFLKEIDKKAKDRTRVATPAQQDQTLSNSSTRNQRKEIPSQQPSPAPAAARANVEKPTPPPQKLSPKPKAKELSQNVNNSKTNTNVTTSEDNNTTQKLSLRERMTAKLFKSSPNPAGNTKTDGPAIVIDRTTRQTGANVDSFKPEDDLDNSFLEDSNKVTETTTVPVPVDSSDDEADGNPLVTADEDIDLDEFVTENANVANTRESDDDDFSDSDEPDIAKDEDFVLQPEPAKKTVVKSSSKGPLKFDLKFEYDTPKTSSQPRSPTSPISQASDTTDGTEPQSSNLNLDDWLNDDVDLNVIKTEDEPTKSKKGKGTKKSKKNKDTMDFSYPDNAASPTTQSSPKYPTSLDEFLQQEEVPENTEVTKEKKKKKKKKSQGTEDSQDKDKKKKHKKKKKKSEENDYDEL